LFAKRLIQMQYRSNKSNLRSIRSATPFYFVQRWILLTALVLCCGVLSGCDMGTYAKRLNDSTPAPAPRKVAAKPKAKKKEPTVVGKWVLDNKSTIAASRKEFAKNILLDGKEYFAAMKDAVLEFDLAEDGTFTCREEILGEKADYTGKWMLTNKRLDLIQKTKNGFEEHDNMVGKFKGDWLDMEHDSRLLHGTQLMHMPFHFVRP